jgi:hypothetical protein
VRPLSAVLGVLRRPQVSADRDRKLIARLWSEAHDPRTLGLLGTPAISLVRGTMTSWGQRIFLTPHLPPTRRQRARLPRGLRGATVADQAAIVLSPMSSGAFTGLSIQAGRAWASESRRNVDLAGGRFVFLIPDGVARVAIWTAGSTAAARPVIVGVHDNVAAFQSATFRSPGREVWYGPTGRVVKRIANASSCAPPLGNCA